VPPCPAFSIEMGVLKTFLPWLALNHHPPNLSPKELGSQAWAIDAWQNLLEYYVHYLYF
jgi:hypothetical protein